MHMISGHDRRSRRIRRIRRRRSSLTPGSSLLLLVLFLSTLLLLTPEGVQGVRHHLRTFHRSRRGGSPAGLGGVAPAFLQEAEGSVNEETDDESLAVAPPGPEEEEEEEGEGSVGTTFDAGEAQEAEDTVEASVEPSIPAQPTPTEAVPPQEAVATPPETPGTAPSTPVAPATEAPLQEPTQELPSPAAPAIPETSVLHPEPEQWNATIPSAVPPQPQQPATSPPPPPPPPPAAPAAVDWDLESRIQKLIFRVDRLDAAMEEARSRSEALTKDQESIVEQFTDSLEKLKTEIDILRARESQHTSDTSTGQSSLREPLNMEGLLDRLLSSNTYQRTSFTPSLPGTPAAPLQSQEPSSQQVFTSPVHPRESHRSTVPRAAYVGNSFMRPVTVLSPEEYRKIQETHPGQEIV